MLVKHLGRSLNCYCTVVDMADQMRPKRVRVQKGIPSEQGNVLMPSEYEFRCWADEEED